MYPLEVHLLNNYSATLKYRVKGQFSVINFARIRNLFPTFPIKIDWRKLNSKILLPRLYIETPFHERTPSSLLPSALFDLGNRNWFPRISSFVAKIGATRNMREDVNTEEHMIASVHGGIIHDRI